MNENDQAGNESMDRLLRQAYQKVDPADSWQGLRRRIDGRLERQSRRSSVRLWRRTALALAACLAVTLGLLIHLLVQAGRAGGPADPSAIARAPLLEQGQLNRLTAIFEQIHEMFADQAS
jgi:hypothetical protein